MRDQRLGIELALGNELQRFLAIASVNAAGLEVFMGWATSIQSASPMDCTLLYTFNLADLSFVVLFIIIIRHKTT